MPFTSHKVAVLEKGLKKEKLEVIEIRESISLLTLEFNINFSWLLG